MFARALVGILFPPIKMSLLELFLLIVVALPQKSPLCYVFLLLTPPLKWSELVLIIGLKPRSIAVALAFSLLFLLVLIIGLKPQSIAVALAFSLLFPLVLIFFSANHSRASTDKHTSFYQRAIQIASEGLIKSPDFGSSKHLRLIF